MSEPGHSSDRGVLGDHRNTQRHAVSDEILSARTTKSRGGNQGRNHVNAVGGVDLKDGFATRPKPVCGELLTTRPPAAEIDHRSVIAIERAGRMNPAQKPAIARSIGRRFGARSRERFTINNWCLSKRDSATTDRTPPEPTGFMTVTSRWKKRLARCGIGRS